MFPLVSFEMIDDADADGLLVSAGHYLGECNRPFGRQSFGLFVGSALVAVAVSASTVSSTCGGYARTEVVELARLVSSPERKQWTRVALRCWRETAPEQWSKYWNVKACVSYSNETRHKGDIYRFDGWTRYGTMPGSSGGGTYTKPRAWREPKTLWIYERR